MDLFEIYNMRHPWNGCPDARPWVIVGFPEGRNVIACFPIATQCYQGDCFYVDENHPDFAATGLAHSSNVIDRYIIEVPGNNVLQKRGAFVGGLLREFRKFSDL